jgi:glucose-6-phosphate 1-dehydrogenase
MTSSPVAVSAVPKDAATHAATGPTVHGDPCTLVIFGAAGDLARRKLVPAVYYLAAKGLLAHDFRVIGVGQEPLDDDRFRTLVREALGNVDEVHAVDEAVVADLERRLFWVSGDLAEPLVYVELERRLAEFECALPEERRNRLFYLALPPPVFETTVRHLSAAGVCPRTEDARRAPWRRLVIEKPFGRSLATAQHLNRVVLEHFSEHQAYRIDHYVGKETVQNLLVLRSANALFESIWSREHISHVQITAAETVGVEARAKYYEQSGVVRDMFQNHLLQLLALTAMEPPERTDADAIRDEKVRVLRAVRPLVDGDDVHAVFAQYVAGEIKGVAVPGYREEPGIASTSTTPTYAALRVEIDNDRWRGVPFHLRSGKRMAKRTSEIAIHFRPPKRLMYEPCPGEQPAANVLAIRLQPNDGIGLGFTVKLPGAALALTPGIEIAPVEMDFSYARAFGDDQHPAYETLLLDCMIGDATLFTRSDEVEAQWRVVDPLLAHWEERHALHQATMPKYGAGTWGPAEAEAAIAKDGFAWRRP